MTAYWMARARILDPAEYHKYAERVPEIIATHGGRVLARGGEYRTLEGPRHFERYVLIEFDSLEAAVGCFESAEYVEAASYRRRPGVGDNEMTIVEGVLMPGRTSPAPER
jgi:uncharacterized protein (DUF1330 family)